MEESRSKRPWHLLVLSARTPQALEVAVSDLAEHLSRNPDVDLGNVAYTLQVGRKRFEHRLALVCRDVAEAREALLREQAQPLGLRSEASSRPVVFMFPGQGAQYVGMGQGLYETEPVFRKHVDECCTQLAPLLSLDLRRVLFASATEAERAAGQLVQTALAQPALFVVEYALAKLWISLGVVPEAMIGHSLGEYVAACLAGVFSLEKALALVWARARLMQALPGGAMVSVSRDAREVAPWLGTELSLAASNAPTLCVISGPTAAIEELEARLRAERVEHRRLRTSHAFHSEMMAPLMEEFEQCVLRAEPRAPRLPYVSNLTGTWVTSVQARSPRYWAEHLRKEVLFGEGIRMLQENPERIFLEVGPGQTLGALVRQNAGPHGKLTVVASLSLSQETKADAEVLWGALGRLWMVGAPLEAKGFYAGERRQRIPLPTYPFQRKPYWVEPRRSVQAQSGVPTGAGPVRKRPDLADWFYVPAWRATPSSVYSPSTVQVFGRWMVFAKAEGLGARLAEHISLAGADVVTVTPAETFSRDGDGRYGLRVGCLEDYQRLLSELGARGWTPAQIVHLWSVGGLPADEQERSSDARLAVDLERGFYSVMMLTQALLKDGPASPIALTVVTEGAQDVTGDEPLVPGRATVLGPCKVIPQEHPRLQVRSVDMSLSASGGELAMQRMVEQLVAEMVEDRPERAVAFRGSRRWVETFEPSRLDAPRAGAGLLRERGVYLITGGLGRIGLAVAEHLAQEVQARLVLMGRSPLPEREGWNAFISTHGPEDGTSRKLQRLMALEQLGAEVQVIQGDVGDFEQMEAAFLLTYQRFGALHGVIHSAGVIGPQTMIPVDESTPERCEALFLPKVRGLRSLHRALVGRALDFVVVNSSLSAALGGLGFAAYAAANLYMDSFASIQCREGAARWISIDWDGWAGGASGVELALSDAEGVEALRRALTARIAGRWVVSTGDLSARLAIWVQAAVRSTTSSEAAPETAHARPNLRSAYAAPRDEIERGLVAIWQELLGVQPIGIHDNFFELGGHSLLGMQVMSRLRDTFQIEMALQILFEAPTVAQMTLAIVEARVSSIGNDALEQMLNEVISQ